LDVIASQMGHRDLRMKKRYARIASTQVRRAVAGLDSVLAIAQKAQAGDGGHRSPAARPALPETTPVMQ
jgi:hypothetical protein